MTKNVLEMNECKNLVVLLNNKLNENFNAGQFVAVAEQPLRYYAHGKNIDFNKLVCDKANYPSFKIDILIYEYDKTKNKKIPRVAIETKLKSFSTHDVLTYSAKVQKHKILCPYLQYGFVVLHGKEEALPCRYFNHADNFDFAYMYQDGDFENFYKNIIIKAIENSQNIEKIDKILCDDKDSKSIKWYRTDTVLE